MDEKDETSCWGVYLELAASHCFLVLQHFSQRFEGHPWSRLRFPSLRVRLHAVEIGYVRGDV